MDLSDTFLQVTVAELSTLKHCCHLTQVNAPALTPAR